MKDTKKHIYDTYISVQRNVPGNIPSCDLSANFPEAAFSGFQKTVLPRKLILDSINTCNANCVFCAYQYKEDPNRNMGIELVDNVTRSYAKFHPHSFISFTPTVGDPLIDPDIFKKVDKAKDNGIERVQFYTNAILLNRRLDELLNSNLDNLEISFPDFDRRIYNQIFRVDRYRQALEGISNLLKRLRDQKRKLPVKINIRGSRPLTEIMKSPDYLDFILPYLTDYIFISDTPEFDNWMGQIKQEDLPEGMRLADDDKKKWKKPCIRTFDLQILPDGDVRLCGCRFKTTVKDDLVIGNLGSASLEEIWFSDKAYTMRNSFFNSTYPSACQNCSYYEAVGEMDKRRYMLVEPPK